MSTKIANALAGLPPGKQKNITRAGLLALIPDKIYGESRTEQCHKDTCDIQKIMARFDKTGTISHINKYEAVYADFSDFDFREQTTRLTAGREIFDALPAEIRDEFRQSPQAFFDFVNDPANKDDLLEKLPALAKPGTQLPRQAATLTADEMAAKAAADLPAGDPPPADTPPAATADE